MKTKVLIAIIGVLLIVIGYLIATTDRYYYFGTGKKETTGILGL